MRMVMLNLDQRQNTGLRESATVFGRQVIRVKIDSKGCGVVVVHPRHDGQRMFEALPGGRVFEIAKMWRRHRLPIPRQAERALQLTAHG